MGKEKEMIKEILSNTQLILKHLKIEVPEKTESKKEDATNSPNKIKRTDKKMPAKKTVTKKK